VGKSEATVVQKGLFFWHKLSDPLARRVSQRRKFYIDDAAVETRQPLGSGYYLFALN
jgi:hypothetical protein